MSTIIYRLKSPVVIIQLITLLGAIAVTITPEVEKSVEQIVQALAVIVSVVAGTTTDNTSVAIRPLEQPQSISVQEAAPEEIESYKKTVLEDERSARIHLRNTIKQKPEKANEQITNPHAWKVWWTGGGWWMRPVIGSKSWIESA